MIDVYAVKFDFSVPFSTHVFERLSDCLEPEKKARLKRFYREEDRLRGLFADLLIRDVVSQRTGMRNHEISYSTNEYGKPSLRNRSDIHFNISHSGVWVVGVIDTAPVGIDVEQVQEIDLSISENYFSRDEHEDLMSKPDKFDYFFTLWALKESYIKILGKGLSHPLNAFSMKFLELPDKTGTTEHIIMNVENKRVSDVFFRMYDIDKTYKTAVCASHPQIPPEVHFVSTTHLTEKFLYR